MKKVVYSVSKRNGSQKWSGVGYLAEDNLFTIAISKNGKPYIKVIEGIKGHCVPNGRDKEYSGIVTQALENVMFFVCSSWEGGIYGFWVLFWFSLNEKEISSVLLGICRGNVGFPTLTKKV